MKKPKVFLTRELPSTAMEMLSEHTELTWNKEDRVLSREELIQGVAGQDALLCLLTDQIDAGIMDAGSGLKVIANYAVGFNNIDVAAATARQIAVTNTPGVLTETTADMAFALLLSAARRIPEGDRYVRSGEWKGWGPQQMLGLDVYGATLGLIGLGSIGRAMARRARGFDMQLVYWNRTRLEEQEEQQLGLRYLPLDEVLRTADYVSLHVAYHPATHHLIDERALSLMKRSAILINTARGPVVDEQALVRALSSGALGGAGLDVFEREPLLEPGLDQLERAVLAPHLGSATIGTRTRMGIMAVTNLLAVCRGEVPPNLVNAPGETTSTC